jgi:hypothetical protein
MATRNRYAEIMAQYAQSQPFSFTGYPQSYTGGYDATAYTPAAAPANRYADIMAQDATTGRVGGNGRPIDYNPEWTAKSDAEKADFYAQNPFFSKVTQLGQNIFGYTWPGALQKGVVPDFVARQKLIAQGINPDDGSGDPTAGRYMGYTDAYGSDPSASFGFVQAPGENRGGFLGVTPQQAAYQAAIAAANAEGGGFTANPMSSDPAQQAATIRQAEADSAAARASEAAAAQAAAAAQTAAQGNTSNEGRGGGGGGYSGAPSGGSDVGRSAPGSAHYAKGGHVSMMHLQGPNPMGPDDGYGALKDGEYVINDKAVKKYGIELMDAINSGKISKGKLRGLLEM